MKFINTLKRKYQIVARKPDELCEDFKEFVELEKQEFDFEDQHLSLEKRKKLVAARKKSLEKQEDKIIADINNDPKLTKEEKESDIKRFHSHVNHYEKGLESVANAIAWRDAEDVVAYAKKNSPAAAAKKYGINIKNVRAMLGDVVALALEESPEKAVEKYGEKRKLTLKDIKAMLDPKKRDIPNKEWAKKALDPKGDKLGSDNIAAFAIPAGITCPKAGSCKNHCFAMTGHTAHVQNVRDTHSAALGLSERDDFVENMNEQIQKKFKTSKHPDPKNPYRIHAWGDFYSSKYAQKWLDIIKANPNVWFYAYTKSITMPAIQSLLKGIKKGTIKNAKIIQSLNGKDDKKIDPTQPIAVVFKSKSDMDAWNNGVQAIDMETYAKQQKKRLAELAKEIPAMRSKLPKDEEEWTEDQKYGVALLEKEERKLKKEKADERETSYAKLSKVLNKLKVYSKDGQFIECADSDLVAANPENKRIGIVEHGELHQPRNYKIDEVDDNEALASVNDAGYSSSVCCEHMQGH